MPPMAAVFSMSFYHSKRYGSWAQLVRVVLSVGEDVGSDAVDYRTFGRGTGRAGRKVVNGHARAWEDVGRKAEEEWASHLRLLRLRPTHVV